MVPTSGWFTVTSLKSLDQQGWHLRSRYRNVVGGLQTVSGKFYALQNWRSLWIVLQDWVSASAIDHSWTFYHCTTMGQDCRPASNYMYPFSSSIIIPTDFGYVTLGDSQDSQGSLSNSVEIESQSTALVSSPISTSSLLQSSQSQDDGVAAGNLTTKQLLNRCVSVPREMFTALTTDE